jgi:hypothetical protein
VAQRLHYGAQDLGLFRKNPGDHESSVAPVIDAVVVDAVVDAVVAGVPVDFAVPGRLRPFVLLFVAFSGAGLSISNGLLLQSVSVALSSKSAKNRVNTANNQITSVTTTIDKLNADATLKTREGRSLEVIQISVGETRISTSAPAAPSKKIPRFLVQGGLHGNEKLPPKFILWLATRVARGESALNHLPLDRFDIDFLPAANPDGGEANTRANKAGVNLNRNFGVLWGISRENPGTTSFSEPETRAIKSLFEKRGYTATVDVHGYIKWLVAPSQPQMMADESLVNETRTARYKSWIQSLTKIAGFLGGYQMQTAGGLGDGGAFEDWAFWKADAFSFCLELASAERFNSSASQEEAGTAGFSGFQPASTIRGFARKFRAENTTDSFLTYEHAIFMAFSEAATASTISPSKMVSKIGE